MAANGWARLDCLVWIGLKTDDEFGFFGKLTIDRPIEDECTDLLIHIDKSRSDGPNHIHYE